MIEAKTSILSTLWRDVPAVRRENPPRHREDAYLPLDIAVGPLYKTPQFLQDGSLHRLAEVGRTPPMAWQMMHGMGSNECGAHEARAWL